MEKSLQSQFAVLK